MMPELKADRLELPNGWYLLDFDPSVEKPRPWKIMRPNGDWLGSMIYGHEFAKAMATRPDGGDSLREAKVKPEVVVIAKAILEGEESHSTPNTWWLAREIVRLAALAAKDGE